MVIPKFEFRNPKLETNSEFKYSNVDEVAKSRKTVFFVIPAKAGIQSNQ